MEDSSSDPHGHSAHHPHHATYGQSGKVIEPVESDDSADQSHIPVHHGERPEHQAPPEPPVPPQPFTPREDPVPLPPRPPIPPAEPATQSITVDPDHPLAVAEVYSTYGIEYLIMFVSLAAAAIGLGSLLDAIVDLAGSKSGGTLGAFLNPYAEAALIVSFPIFVFLFLRLESKEEADPSLIADASRRRGMQIVLVISFVVILGSLITYIGTLLNGSNADTLSAAGGYGSGSGFSNFMHALIELAIAGGIFGYYWYKLHKKTLRIP